MPLYPYQETVFNHLMEGRNVILQAPTGAGKTQAALYPFLTALDPAPDNPWRGRLPTRCIYSVPMRVLARQFDQKHKNPIARYRAKYKLEITQSIQMGEQPEDPTFTSNLIFATIDQTLSSYLLAPYSLGRRQANLNAGAVMSSYLVFDEFHLYDPASTLPTTLQMLKTLKDITPFVLMTATFSQTLLGELANLLGAVIVPGDETERDGLDELPSQQKERTYQVADQPMSAEAVWATHEQRSLVICNTVDRARQLHRRLREIASPETEVILLHSQFLRDDRNRIEDRIRELCGKEAQRQAGSAIVVSTQAIEVGVDMSCHVLHTELAPANAIIQRAGRCARYPGEVGTAFIYSEVVDAHDPEECIDLASGDPLKSLPYKSQAHLFPLTLEAFRERQGKLTFKLEQEILSQVHNADDKQLIAEITQSGNTYQQRIHAVQSGVDSEQARNLIRDMRQVNVIIQPDPKRMLETMTASPLLMPAFSLHPGSVLGYLKDWQERATQLNLPWAVKYLYEFTEKKGPQSEKPEEDRPRPTMDEQFKWQEVKVAADAQYARLLVINPLLATYDPERGLVPDSGGDWQSPLPEQKDKAQQQGSYGYRLETYADHILLVHKAFIELWPELEWAAARLEQRYGWATGSIRRAAELTVLLHDVGKLSEGWQGWVQRYQAAIGEGELEPGQAYAHTHSQTEEHQKAAKQIGKRPWHAVEGAISSLPILDALIATEPLKKAAIGAIARHHAPFSDENCPYRLVRHARQRMAETFAGTGYTPDLSDVIDQAERETMRDFMPLPGESEDRGAGFLAYLLIVRALRRADVEGTKAGSGLT